MDRCVAVYCQRDCGSYCKLYMFLEVFRKTQSGCAPRCVVLFCVWRAIPASKAVVDYTPGAGYFCTLRIICTDLCPFCVQFGKNVHDIRHESRIGYAGWDFYFGEFEITILCKLSSCSLRLVFLLVDGSSASWRERDLRMLQYLETCRMYFCVSLGWPEEHQSSLPWHLCRSFWIKLIWRMTQRGSGAWLKCVRPGISTHHPVVFRSLSWWGMSAAFIFAP